MVHVGGLEVEEVEEGGVVHGGRSPRWGSAKGEAVGEGGVREDVSVCVRMPGGGERCFFLLRMGFFWVSEREFKRDVIINNISDGLSAYMAFVVLGAHVSFDGAPSAAACRGGRQASSLGLVQLRAAQHSSQRAAQHSSGAGVRRRRSFIAVAVLAFSAASWAPRDGSAEQLGDELAQDADAGMELRETFRMIDKGAIQGAEPRLTESLAEFETRRAPPEHMAVLYKYRADVRVNVGKLEEARKDYASAIKLLEAATASPDREVSEMMCIGSTEVSVSRYSGRQQSGVAEYCTYVPSLPDLLLRRARISILLGGGVVTSAETDLSKVIALAEEEGALQPYAHLYRGDSRMLLAEYADAAADYKTATRDFAAIGDKASAEVALCVCAGGGGLEPHATQHPHPHFPHGILLHPSHSEFGRRWRGRAGPLLYTAAAGDSETSTGRFGCSV